MRCILFCILYHSSVHAVLHDVLHVVSHYALHFRNAFCVALRAAFMVAFVIAVWNMLVYLKQVSNGKLKQRKNIVNMNGVTIFITWSNDEQPLGVFGQIIKTQA